MAANLKLTLIGEGLRGLLLRFENAGTSPVAVIRSDRSGLYASHDLSVLDASGRRVPENVDVMCCGTYFPLTADALIVIPPGGAAEVGVDTEAYDLPPGSYRLQVTYSTSAVGLRDVDPKPPGFEHLAQGVWTSNEVLTK